MGIRDVKLWKVNAKPMDLMFFVSKEFNQTSRMDAIIHPYALAYAIGTVFNIVSVDNTPKYSELYSRNYYVYPGIFVNNIVSQMYTYNFLDDITNSPIKSTIQTKNYPIIGTYEKLLPLKNEFVFYVLQFQKDNMHQPEIIRLGKKLVPVELQWIQKDFQILQSDQLTQFTWPILIEDFSINSVLQDYQIHYMSPSSVIQYGQTNSIVLSTNEVNLAIPKHLL